MPLYSINDALDIVDIGASSLDPSTNALVVQIKGNPLDEDDPAQAESLDGVPVFSALGVTARPYPSDDSGTAQGLFHRGINVIIGQRDTRTTAIIGALAPGDTAVHSTGPQQAAQLQLKETRQAVLMTKDSTGKDMIFVLDGDTDQITLSAFKHFVSLDRVKGVTLSAGGAASISLKPDGTIILTGNVVISGKLTSLPGTTITLPPGPNSGSPVPLILL